MKMSLAVTLIVSCVMVLSCIERVETPQKTQEIDKENQPLEMTTYYVVFLRKGPNWTADVTPEIEEVLKGHMAHIEAMVKSDKLTLAGPFLEQTGEGSLAGMFVFRVDSLEQAIELTEMDPGVKSGRFTYKVVPWLGPQSLSY